ncbi:threonine aspartase 1-like [Amphiura filiformis]|uniref:threonine aspartase 1-like n=1 Tax=Amphiura filiformis TaxID=82378 RepID=UPI003B2268EB
MTANFQKSFIAVHVGAGYHSIAMTDAYKEACQNACLAGLAKLDAGEHALEGAAAAVAVLEDDQITNAGTGSNLNLHGNVECDASIMDGERLLFGAVGALSGVKNPISVAKEVVKEQIKGQMSLGRVPPSVLVGNGALKWACDHDIGVVSGSDMISQKALSAYRKHKQRLMEVEQEARLSAKRSKLDADIEDIVNTPENSLLESIISTPEESLLDTVGVVCMDAKGNVCSASSSGGIALKHPGRVGQTGIFGSGCWAQNGNTDTASVACCTTGCGEHLMRTLLAKECYDSLTGSDNASLAISTVFKNKFLESPMLNGVKFKFGGALVVKCWGHDDVELVWAHTTKSMCIGYMMSGEKKGKTVMSRLSDTSVAGISLSVGGKHFHT